MLKGKVIILNSIFESFAGSVLFVFNFCLQ